jgi:hypothetical protein
MGAVGTGVGGESFSVRSAGDSPTAAGVRGAEAAMVLAIAGSIFASKPIFGGSGTVGVTTTTKGGEVGWGVGIFGAGAALRRQPVARNTRMHASGRRVAGTASSQPHFSGGACAAIAKTPWAN